METLFRRAEPADAPAMARLVADAWKKAYRGILPDALLDGINVDMRSERTRKTIETNPDFWYYVLETGGEIVGVSGLCALSDGDLPGVGEIMIFYIRPDKQRLGLGRIMMRNAVDALREKGFKRIALWVLKENHSARAFYEAAGFAADGAEKAMAHLENAAAVRYRYGETQ